MTKKSNAKELQSLLDQKYELFVSLGESYIMLTALEDRIFLMKDTLKRVDHKIKMIKDQESK